MPWFKVDDGWWSHPKVLALSDAAQALWVRAGSYSMKHMTDGTIPAVALVLLRSKPRVAQELVSTGLWESDGDAYRFHDWEKYQPSRGQLESDRAAAAERQRRARESRRDKPVTHGVSHAAPSHPIPTQPTRSSKRESQGGTTGGSEPPLFCPEHPFGGAGKCGPCGDARKTHAKWEREQNKPPSLKRPRKGDGHDCIDDGNGWCAKCGEKVA